MNEDLLNGKYWCIPMIILAIYINVISVYFYMARPCNERLRLVHGINKR